MSKIKKLKKAGEKVGGVFNEFKSFILRGNVIDLAIGVIIGGSFQKIITALVDKIIMPVISWALSKGKGAFDISKLFFALDGKHYDTIADAKAATTVVPYGEFLMMLLDFILMAAVVFCIIKGINAISRARNKDGALVILAETKQCPYCRSAINPAAVRCPNCTSNLPDEDE
ncbi:MAG: large conductance mechanosensitive channel protein MscL [Oscillospiraceae bacterium]|jgi:large conductance mechanosensitive channel|nr:large conductance mechanosensitive channel protein MscL [Oscillospiraceae bacterium]